MKITNIKQQAKRVDRYSVFVEGKYAFSLSQTALLDLGLAAGQELDAAQLARFKEASGNDKAYGNALRYVAMRPRSEWEVRTYLQRKAVDERVATDIIQRLRSAGFLDDRQFARSWIASRQLLKQPSRRRLRLELQQKHLETSLIDQVLTEDSVSEHDNLRRLVTKKRARYPDRNKFIQYLVRQGFGYDDIKTVLDDEPTD